MKRSSFFYACKAKKNEIAKRIFNKKIPDLNESLYASCESENEEMIIFLIKNGANKNYFVPSTKKTLIHVLCEKVNLDLLKIVCKKSIFSSLENEMNGRDVNGNTSLHSINYSLHSVQTLDLAKFLLKNKANLNLKNNFGESCLSLSCISENVQLSDFFLNSGNVFFFSFNKKLKIILHHFLLFFNFF